MDSVAESYCKKPSIKRRNAPPEAWGKAVSVKITWFRLDLISGSTAPFADAVGVNRCTAAANGSANQSALFASGNPANQGAGTHTSCCCELVTVLLPEAATVLVIVPNTPVMRVRDVAVPVPEAAASLSRNRNRHQREQNRHYQNGK
jgi:hypothetical protein